MFVYNTNNDSTIYLVAFYEPCRIWPASDVRCRPTGVCTFSSTAERPGTISLVCARCDCWCSSLPIRTRGVWLPRNWAGTPSGCGRRSILPTSWNCSPNFPCTFPLVVNLTICICLFATNCIFQTRTAMAIRGTGQSQIYRPATLFWSRWKKPADDSRLRRNIYIYAVENYHQNIYERNTCNMRKIRVFKYNFVYLI